MATDLKYLHPTASLTYEMDFEAELPGDTALKDVTAGSLIFAKDYAGTDVSTTILSSKTRTAMVLSVVVSGVTEGQEYIVTFIGVGATTSKAITKTLEVRARTHILGAF